MVHIYNGLLLSHKKEWNNAICSNMDAPRDYHTKWSKPKKKSYHIAHMWNWKKKKERDTDELIYKTEIYPQTWKTSLWLPKRKGEGAEG